MAVAHDSSTDITRNSAATTFTFSHTCAGSDRCLLSFARGPSDQTITGITYNGVSMTALPGTDGVGNTTFLANYGFYLLDPATGANNVVVTANTSTTIIAGAVSFTGVEDLDTAEEAEGISSAATDTITSESGDMVVDCWSANWGLGDDTPGSGQTLWGAFSNGDDFQDLQGSYESGASSVVMDWTNTQNAWFKVTVNLNAAAVAGGGSSLLTLTGVG